MKPEKRGQNSPAAAVLLLPHRSPRDARTGQHVGRDGVFGQEHNSDEIGNIQR